MGEYLSNRGERGRRREYLSNRGEQGRRGGIPVKRKEKIDNY